MKSMNREDAAEIIAGMIAFGCHTAIEDQALTLAINVLNNPTKCLYPQERREVYFRQEHDYDLQDIKNQIQIRFEYYSEVFDIGEKPVTDEELEQMANEMRRLLDDDCEKTWYDCAQYAIVSVLSKRQNTGDEKP